MTNIKSELRKDIREYVAKGGRDTFDFAVFNSPKYDKIPGKEIKRIIDEEASISDLERDVRTFVENGGNSAHDFFVEHSPYYIDVPTGRVERMIIEETTKRSRIT